MSLRRGKSNWPGALVIALVPESGSRRLDSFVVFGGELDSGSAPNGGASRNDGESDDGTEPFVTRRAAIAKV